MSEPSGAGDADLAEQAVPADGGADDGGADGFSVNAEADVADLVEQHRGAPLPDDDYDR